MTRLPKADIAALDIAAATDARYFAEHRGEKAYMRRPLPGEFPLLPGGWPVNLVRVEELEPGVRLRTPGFCPVVAAAEEASP